MLDREARNRLASMIEAFLNERTTAFEFDDRINRLLCTTQDEAVHHVVQALWFHYDDVDDHTVALSKEEWDYVQRLLLLLKSDAGIRIERRRNWSWRQLVACLTLICFLMVAIPTGLGEHLYIVAIPFGVVSIILSKAQPIPSKTEIRQLTARAPFASTAQLLSVRRSVAGFQKRRYPQPLAKKRIRSSFMDLVYDFQAHAYWLIGSPLALLFQAMPSSECEVTVIAQ